MNTWDYQSGHVLIQVMWQSAKTTNTKVSWPILRVAFGLKISFSYSSIFIQFDARTLAKTEQSTIKYLVISVTFMWCQS